MEYFFQRLVLKDVFLLENFNTKVVSSVCIIPLSPCQLEERLSLNPVLHEIKNIILLHIYLKKRENFRVYDILSLDRIIFCCKSNSIAFRPIVSLPENFFPLPTGFRQSCRFLLLEAQTASQRESSNKYHQSFKNAIAYVN